MLSCSAPTACKQLILRHVILRFRLVAPQLSLYKSQNNSSRQKLQPVYRICSVASTSALIRLLKIQKFSGGHCCCYCCCCCLHTQHRFSFSDPKNQHEPPFHWINTYMIPTFKLLKVPGVPGISNKYHFLSSRPRLRRPENETAEDRCSSSSR